LTNQTLKFKPVVKDRLFYDRYQYSVSFHLDEVSCLRSLDHNYIDTMINRRIHYREISQQRWVNNNQSVGTIVSRRWKDITESTIKNLHDVADTLLESNIDFKLVTSVETAWVYTNDRSLLTQIDNLNFLKWKTYTKAIVDRPRNTIKLKRLRHNHRGYFKTTKLTAMEKDQLINFFKNQQGHLRCSPALTAWLSQPYHRTQDYFFIDYDKESWLVMLALIHPGLIRKTVDLIAA
jgi:hypothetical protein